jgi:hypothetical protein
MMHCRYGHPEALHLGAVDASAAALPIARPQTRADLRI